MAVNMEHDSDVTQFGTVCPKIPTTLASDTNKIKRNNVCKTLYGIMCMRSTRHIFPKDSRQERNITCPSILELKASVQTYGFCSAI